MFTNLREAARVFREWRRPPVSGPVDVSLKCDWVSRPCRCSTGDGVHFQVLLRRRSPRIMMHANGHTLEEAIDVMRGTLERELAIAYEQAFPKGHA